jgi:hypothetical protein
MKRSAIRDGSAAGTPFPDFAALHPGYKLPAVSLKQVVGGSGLFHVKRERPSLRLLGPQTWAGDSISLLKRSWL